ncbi:ferrous iron transport protein B [Methanosphaerula palustris]|uniref:Ferrous iron transport protein B n=1 Tax=Methanosphaerula palustris (strain ATCC BAA-1556 / DSM 19958 / E1-9c) TaxID=521011 RepID=B8GEA9_METPE|nr:ferrous iron transport protein B [Methanosphaerula palustris]ACL17610.1 ferrous iron transport protein B [Methanosphaerula palustris E1-9c]
MKKSIRIALAGNPNVGKSTIFNALTGFRQQVGNWPGVTVEKKSGFARLGEYEIEVVDLPGTYSLTAYSEDEVIARDYIIEEKPDVVVHVVDATNFERNLYLTTQLMELGVPLVIALNMSDMAEKNGTAIDQVMMKKFFEIPAVRTVGSKGEGLDELLRTAIHEAETSPHHEHAIGYGDETERLIAELVTALGKDPALSTRYPPRWLAIRLLEGDENALEKIIESPARNAAQAVLAMIDPAETEAAMADRRYEVITALLPQVCATCVRTMNASDLLDRVITNRWLGIPIFLALMWGAFELTFAAGAPFSDAINALMSYCADLVGSGMEPAWLGSLLGNGIIGGMGAILVFIPNIFILLLLLSILEDSGYLARAAFVMDRLMYSIGLPGKSFIPMLIGFGCNVPAIMATRTIEDPKDRLITILINPFMSCGARLPVYILFAGAFFPENGGTVVFVLYVLGISVAIGSAWLFRKTILPGKPAPFLMEMPPYRLPTFATSVVHMWDRGSMYLRKAGGIILFASIIVWGLASLPFGVEYGSAESFVGLIGHVLEPLVAPLGFDWKIAVALLFGFVAKEVVVGSLGVLYGTGDEGGSLQSALLADPHLGPVTAFALMAFVLLYLPCLTTFAVIRKETGSWKWTGFSVFYGLSVAYIIAFIIASLGHFVIGGN